MHFSPSFLVLLASATSVLTEPSISSFPNSLTLSSPFDPIKAAYWTGLPHHRRTPFAVSPDGKSAYLAYLDSTLENIVVQQVDTTTFTAVGTAVTVKGYEAAGLVAQDDGFALMATIDASGTTDLPTDNMPIVAVIRFKNGAEAWRTPMNGPGVHPDEGLSATPDANGDLVYSAESGLYAAYFVVTSYTGPGAGHFADSIQYVDDSGALQVIDSSSTFGCSHNTGIGLEAADAPPFASVCAEDQGAIWLNTETRTMSGLKISNENTTNGSSGEPMGGMSGSYSNLALFPSSTNYIFAWASRGAIDLTLNDWLGAPNTRASPRWLNRNVAISTMSSKNALTGEEATSTVGAADGDTQVNWITKSETEDHQNVHVAAISSSLALVTWETLSNPTCEPLPLSCTGTYAGTSFQVVDNTGAKVGDAVVDNAVFVSGDIANVGTDRVCWPYVDMVWDLSAPKDSGTPVTTMSFACASTTGGGSTTPPNYSTGSPDAVPPSTSESAPAISNPAVVPDSTIERPYVPTNPGDENEPAFPGEYKDGKLPSNAGKLPAEGTNPWFGGGDESPEAYPTNLPSGYPTDFSKDSKGPSGFPSGYPTDFSKDSKGPSGFPGFPTDFTKAYKEPPTGSPPGYPTDFSDGWFTRWKKEHWGNKNMSPDNMPMTLTTVVRPAPTNFPLSDLEKVDNPVLASDVALTSLGEMAATDWDRIGEIRGGIPAPKKQFDGPKSLYPEEPLRRCQEWTREAIQAWTAAGALHTDSNTASADYDDYCSGEHNQYCHDNGDGAYEWAGERPSSKEKGRAR
ncbi:hypothetical protein MBM_08057 [Drepanopeziza brunnea f. sp. 'multigermtubi' MB_m1]|uniref:Uncharacterized protein n=1 Tax=Marssonina brunnea f. sp. multigermtubi (strain MB_m1) TaxID=1072389 RepID=K1WLV0_MARBU|nr:uncharacterized protein MBM_08057 [Drepanopeziza brunnea f. sp. 'multigermtubi' MB_m1]EKD13856.1 hypothetical protein MBM_08057 [Drepanopeziza brunnea f. sp. 'multigermtubi' MB_m1]